MSNISTEIKSVFLGDSGVGKTCILNYFINGSILEASTPTIGAAYVHKSFTYNEQTYDFMVWDTAGQEMYRGLAPMYYRNARIAFLVFDLTSEKSFNAVSYWANQLKDNVGDDIIIIVCGNKLDLESKRAITHERAEELSQELGAQYVETSAANGNGIIRMFQTATAEFLKYSEKINKPDGNVDLRKSGKGGCC